jgi:hypothetical protein
MRLYVIIYSWHRHRELLLLLLLLLCRSLFSCLCSFLIAFTIFGGGTFIPWPLCILGKCSHSSASAVALKKRAGSWSIPLTETTIQEILQLRN